LWLGREGQGFGRVDQAEVGACTAIHSYIAAVLWGLSDAENRCPEAAGLSWRMCAGHRFRPVSTGTSTARKLITRRGFPFGGDGHAHPSI
jgi:hypothetical protein